MFGDTPFVFFNDADCGTLSHWDRMSDRTLYIFTNPSDELKQKHQALLDKVLQSMAVSVAAAENMTAEGSTEAAALVEQAFRLLDAEDYDAAIPLFQRAADMGDASAQNALGNCYGEGLGVEQDYAKAKVWFEKAAALGNATAMHNLGMMYINGESVEQDCAKAKVWFEKASELGDADAMYNLGLIYFQGEGVEQDAAKALTFFENAAELGNADAQAQAGYQYCNGIGTETDYEKAADYFLKAVELGETSESQANFDQLVEQGKIPADYTMNPDTFGEVAVW